jgi:DMSO/TMAO reductase YedYZ molybdopterin-dependent catalytic subunit
MKEKIISKRRVVLKTIFAFGFFALAFCTGIFIWKKIRHEPQDRGIPKTLRMGLTADERIFSGVFSPQKLVRTYPKSEAVKYVRVNGSLGLKDPSFDTATWRLQVVKRNGDTLSFTMDDIRKLPKTEIVFDFKCIEGWSQKTWWGGVKFSDFISYYHLNEEAQMHFAGLATPDRGYYVGIDMPSILHPQTLLCYEMNGKPLPMNQGNPLRLIIPVKYGIKHIKRIGTIYFSNQRPPDYWAERGYDYYSGH